VEPIERVWVDDGEMRRPLGQKGVVVLLSKYYFLSQERGNRPGNYRLCPPGVDKGQGARPGNSCFDTYSSVCQCLESDSRFCNQPEMVELVKEFRSCDKVLDGLKSTRGGVRFATVEDLVTYIKYRAKCSP
jgi:hypothetical protein